MLERQMAGRVGDLRFVEVEGTHSQVVKDEVAVGKCVGVAIEMLVQKAKGKVGG